MDRQPIDWSRAMEQHLAYRNALREAGFEVRVFDMNLQCPDCAFVEDIAVVLDELIVLGSMGVKSREAESSAWRSILSELRPTFDLPPKATLEGGDVLRLGRCLLIGQSSRTNRIAIEAFNDIVCRFDYRVLVVPIANCLHLKTACTALDDETLLINPEWFDWNKIKSDAMLDLRVLVAADRWGANVVRLPDRLIASSQNRATMEQLCSAGYRVESVDLSEFAKAEAGATCLSLLFE